LQEHFLPTSFTQVFLPWLDKLELDALAYRGKDIFIKSLTPAIAEYLTKEYTPYHEVWSWQNLTQVKLQKVLMIAGLSPAALFEAGHQDLASQVNWVHSASSYWEVLPLGVSKGSALKKLIRFLGLEPEEVVSIGDYLNDMEMLTVSGLGVAVANAHPRLKAVADKVTAGRNWQGVVELIKEICR